MTDPMPQEVQVPDGPDTTQHPDYRPATEEDE